jgi:hypothetical protein
VLQSSCIRSCSGQLSSWGARWQSKITSGRGRGIWASLWHPACSQAWCLGMVAKHAQSVHNMLALYCWHYINWWNISCYIDKYNYCI